MEANKGLQDFTVLQSNCSQIVFSLLDLTENFLSFLAQNEKRPEKSFQKVTFKYLDLFGI